MKQPVGIDQARRDPELRSAFARVERQGRRGVSTMQDALTAWMRDSGLSRRRQVPATHAAFERACGPDLARRARAVRFARGTLTVEVDSAAHLHELEAFRGEELRERTNAILGRPDVRRIVFKPRT